MKLTLGSSAAWLLLLLLTLLPFQTGLIASPGASTIEAPKPRGKPDFKAWKKDRAAAQTALEKQNYEQAEVSLRAALQEAENFAAGDERLAESLNDLAAFYCSCDRDAEAEPLLRRALVVLEKSPIWLEKAQSHLNLALACRNLMKYHEAEKELLTARDITFQQLGRNHPLDAICRFYLAQLYLQQGQLTKAEPLFKEVRNIFSNPLPEYSFQQFGLSRARLMKRSFTPQYNFELQTLTFLGEIYQKQGLLDKAEAALKESVQVAKGMPGSSEPEFQATKILGHFYLSTTNYPQAESVWIRLVKQEEKNFGSKHPETLKTLSTLAFIYEQESRLAEAEATYKKAQAAVGKLNASNSQEVIATTLALADFYVRHDRYEAAELLYKRLMDEPQSSFASDVRGLPILVQQAKIYSKLGKDTELETVYQRQLAIYEKIFGAQNLALAKPLEEYAQLLRKGKRDTEAETLATRARDIRAAKAK